MSQLKDSDSRSMGWNFDNSYARLPHNLYTRQEPVPVRDPELVVLNEPLAASIGLDPAALSGREGAEIFAGNKVPEGAEPLAQAYAGHQFGHFTMLGDGRAVLLGEQITPDGDRLDVQLKGSGRTPYSRGGDGRAALGPMLREYIISEAMHALGIPTSRSLAVVTTGEPVFRDTKLEGAILTRVAASHLRVGTFQYAAVYGTQEDLRALADYAISRHYPEITNIAGNPYLNLLKEAARRQAMLISKWQLVGFIHGVMNTDNMTISGETIDYGPCAFMDTFHTSTVFSSIDYQGRYAYGRQPEIGAWNLARLAEALLPLFHQEEEQAIRLAEEVITDYTVQFHEGWLSGMRAKLGLYNQEPEDEALIRRLLSSMQKHQADYTNTFRALTLGRPDDNELFGSREFEAWVKDWEERKGRQPETAESSLKLMKRSNPAVIPRNHQVEEVLEAAVNQGSLMPLNKLLRVLSRPYDYEADHEAYCEPAKADSGPYRTFCGT